MRKTTLIVLFLNLTLYMYSQQTKTDSVLLSNGNLIIGKTIAFTPNEYIKIQTDKGLFVFNLVDIKKLFIHSVEKYQNGFDNSNQKTEITKSSTSQISRSDITLSENNEIRTSKANLDQDGFPINIFIIQAEADGLLFYNDLSSLKIESQRKFQGIYSHRFWEHTALGIGYAYREFLDYYPTQILFFDARHFNIKTNHFTSLGIDIGLADFVVDPSLYLNTSYNYGFKLEKNLYFTFGLEINLQGNLYPHGGNFHNDIILGFADNYTLGFSVGILL